MDETGLDQALKLARHLGQERIDAVYSSPLKRALQTAEPLANRLGLPVRIEPALLEIDTGQADGLRLEQLKERHPEFWQDWLDGAISLRWPGGESLSELEVRTGEFTARLRSQLGNSSVAVVGHTFSLLFMLLQALGLNVGLYYRFRLEVASISVVKLEPVSATLLKLNDTCHWKDR